ncbi:GTP cyclohydrolase II [Nocardia crassostreae]|uniref:GTP cyclohydrolase II n=1 Tax=Nocardia crassostreae TaxID=53428 RepID=UPI000834E5A9|nr:GTP cyclohydrolase II [Nocardia crassostreae]
MPWADNMIHVMLCLSETQHFFSRKGRKLTIRVVTVGGHDTNGHALIFGDKLPEDCLVRIHSRCLYGEVLRSDDCDCSRELDMSLDLIQHEGAGILIYLEQEGRGAGLIAKARGYQHSERTGADTFTSYEALGIPADLRSYDDAVATLVALGPRSVRLLTNNPEKVAAVRAAGLRVTAVPLHARPRSERARRYLEAKRSCGHHLPDYDRRMRRLLLSQQRMLRRPMRPVAVAVGVGAAGAVGMLVGRRSAPASTS